ncbi:hypothetical protein Gorai_019249, partial [Gossypium raimondii]|nr:hypothetical protein [Gossypium raimondii]
VSGFFGVVVNRAGCCFLVTENDLADLSLEDGDEEDGEDLMKILLVLSTFWVQIHELPPGLFSESIA